MSTATRLPPPAATLAPLLPPAAGAVGSPKPGSAYRWTVERYERLGELGVLVGEDHVELLEGIIVNKAMSDPGHAAPVDELTEFFSAVSANRWRVRCQQPVCLPNQESVPEPDVALVRRNPGGYRAHHPGPADIFLLVEVANTSVAVDRGRKLALYARAGVTEYWIVNVPEGSVEVYRDPQPAAGAYTHAETVRSGAALAPAAFPDAALPVADLFGGGT